MKRFKFLSLCLFFSALLASAQQPATSAELIKQALKQKQELAANSLVKNVAFKNIGPNIMSGRVVDLDVNPENALRVLCGLCLWRGLAYCK